MVHILASHLRSEFLAVPQLVRFDLAHGAEGLEPTLLIKASSLALKYLLRRQSFRLMLMRIGDRIAYAVEIPDDPERAAALWSIAEHKNEIRALVELANNPRCVIFLFNEVAVSVAWVELEVRLESALSHQISSAILHEKLGDNDAQSVGERLDEIRSGAAPSGVQILAFEGVVWQEVSATYITNRAGSSELSLFSSNEGEQQERIAVWLTDNLDFRGCVKSPQVHEKIVRELSDILLTYDEGVFLIESKSLNILTRDNLPDRVKLAGDLAKHIRKASKQLAGGIRNLRNGLTVTDGNGRPLALNRAMPCCAIILVPDLSLLSHAREFGGPFIREFMQANSSYLHILDPAELLRVVQVAEIVANRSQDISRMMAFDWYLMERTKRAVVQPTPDFQILFGG